MEPLPRLLLHLLVLMVLCFSHVRGRTHHRLRTKHVKQSIALPPATAAPPQCSSNETSANCSRAASPAASISLPPSPAPVPSPSPSPVPTVYDVRTFGAVGDGVADDTEAFKAAWYSACQDVEPGAVVLVPRGYSFKLRSAIFTGPCRSSELVLHVDGTMMPPDGPGEWPATNSRKQWLVFYRVNGLTLEGGGLIDGKGAKWWDLPCKPHKGNGTSSGSCDSPVALRFFFSSNLTVRGIKVQNSPQFHFRFDCCRNITVDSIRIASPALSPNTDGIHLENSDGVVIRNSLISNGDDCVSIGAGTANVDIHNITCGPGGHGISIGSLGKPSGSATPAAPACVTNVTVRNCVIRRSDNGVRIKTWQGGAGAVTAVTFAGIHMDEVRNPIIIDQYYCLSKSCPNATSAVRVSGVTYSDIRGTYDVRSPPVHLACSDAVPCTNITLAGVELLPARDYFFVMEPFCWNVYGVATTLTIPPVTAPCLTEGMPRAVMELGTDQCYPLSSLQNLS